MLITAAPCLQGWEGLADSIVGAITVFWLALLTDRAFQMIPTNWRGNSVKCVVNAPHAYLDSIEWRY